MSQRRFGVEVECGIRPYMDRYALINNLHDAGFRNYSVGMDGTQHEIRTPILQGTEGKREFKRLMEFIIGLGGYTTTADGMHVHHDAPEFGENPKATLRLVKSWVANQALIDRFCEARRATSWACPKWRQDEIAALERLAGENANACEMECCIEYYEEEFYYSGPRGTLNLHSLGEHGSIELRQHEGTMDIDKALAWIEFGQRFIDSVAGRKRPIMCVDSTDTLLKRVKVPKKHAEKLLTARPVRTRAVAARNAVAA